MEQGEVVGVLGGVVVKVCVGKLLGADGLAKEMHTVHEFGIVGQEIECFRQVVSVVGREEWEWRSACKRGEDFGFCQIEHNAKWPAEFLEVAEEPMEVNARQKQTRVINA